MELICHLPVVSDCLFCKTVEVYIKLMCYCISATYVSLFMAPQINWEKRKINMTPGQYIFNSLDGTDFKCTEKEDFPENRRWYSHKFNGPGLRYEIALSIKTGDIVWAYGGGQVW